MTIRLCVNNSYQILIEISLIRMLVTDPSGAVELPSIISCRAFLVEST